MALIVRHGKGQKVGVELLRRQVRQSRVRRVDQPIAVVDGVNTTPVLHGARRSLEQARADDGCDQGHCVGCDLDASFARGGRLAGR